MLLSVIFSRFPPSFSLFSSSFPPFLLPSSNVGVTGHQLCARHCSRPLRASDNEDRQGPCFRVKGQKKSECKERIPYILTHTRGKSMGVYTSLVI